MELKKYFSKRNFKKTPEPRGKLKRTRNKELIFVIQKHHARRLHYDFRLEFAGTLKSWAVPKGPSLNPKDKRLAVEVEDHPIDYATFEGDIPEGEYGAGHVIVWDFGTWTPTSNVTAGFKKGHIDFVLHGKKLHGAWSLVRLRSDTSGKNNWLLLKRQDEFVKTQYDITKKEPHSVLSKIARSEKTSQKNASAKKKRSSPPRFIEPQLAQLVTAVPPGEDWIHEIKFDGYRTLIRLDKGKAQFLTRRGKNWTKKYGPLQSEALKLKLQNAVIDGELVWIDEMGHTDFQKLQNGIAEQKFQGMIFYAFDLLFLDGEDLLDQPLLERKKLLKELLDRSPKSKIIYSEHWKNQGSAMYKESCRLGLEGIVSKNAEAAYSSGRSGLWQKTKCSLRQEFVIVGYTESSADDRPFGALLLGSYHSEKNLKYVGRVGTGFSAGTFKHLTPLLQKLRSEDSPISEGAPRSQTIQWTEPKLAAEIEFKGWTQEGVLRQASFQGLREDKKPTDIHVEKPMKKNLVTKVKISHPDRIVYKKTKTTKLVVVQYYEAIAPYLIPFVEDRPLSILRCQQDTQKACYFQKHSEASTLVGIESKPVHYKEKSDTALTVQSPTDLLELAQAGAIEIHVWSGQFSHITKPDQIVFDLDPETEKLWPRVVETAHLIREMLEQLELKSFVKVTGGKGLHVQVPITPRYSWDTIKEFSKSLMRVLEDKNPEHYTTNMSKSKRKGRIFLDYLRNGYGATAVVPYSLRARVLPTVALPISWREVKPSLSPDEFLLSEVLKKLKRRKDPWTDYWDLDQRIKILEKKSTSSLLGRIHLT
ncbi:MAG: DNA ligase D [Bdellovibrionales bacterium]